MQTTEQKLAQYEQNWFHRVTSMNNIRNSDAYNNAGRYEGNVPFVT